MTVIYDLGMLILVDEMNNLGISYICEETKVYIS